METSKKAHTGAAATGDGFAGRRVHLIGIGGSGMCALAEVLLAQKALVTGSDMAGGEAVDRLTKDGAVIAIGQRPENLPPQCDLVVCSAAIHPQNPEYLAAKARGLEIVKYSQMLGRLMRQKLGIAVAGTHGKSTTSAMISYALYMDGADPSFIVGAVVDQLGTPSGAGAGPHFVAEACEFDRSFLNLDPTCALILNIEEDHLDCYQDLDGIIEAFRSFAARVPAHGLVIANGEDRNTAAALRTGQAPTAACQVQTFGLTDGCYWQGVIQSRLCGCVKMEVRCGGKSFCEMTLALPGLHNAYNALAATAALHYAGMPPARIAQWVGQFTGAKRRIQFRARAKGITVVDDYAHHPTEIQASLKAIRDYYEPKRLLCVFQPHQHSRTRFLINDFARCFDAANEIVVPDIYFVRDSEREKDHISSEDLVSQIRLHGGSARYIKTFTDIIRFLQAQLTPGDVVVTMGAGNIWEVADEIVRWLGSDR
ncbi:MAG: UDP-N-acetylmuramate--L-alanine ligase [Planctomycetota bacterium]|nr:UDP-N-acetylmuramate--L-alanine ligase [Planctomycetota bacterium]